MRSVTLLVLNCLLIIGTVREGFAMQHVSDGTLVRVFDDSRRGVASELYKVLADEGETKRRLGKTDTTGILPAVLECQQGERVRAQPVSDHYFANAVECPRPARDTLRILVPAKPLVAELGHTASALEARGELAAGALAYNEYFARLAEAGAGPLSEGLPTAREARLKVFELFAKYLGVADPTVFDAVQQLEVMSPELRARVVEFQAEGGLPGSGIIDYRTLNMAADVSTSQLLYGQVPEGGSELF